MKRLGWILLLALSSQAQTKATLAEQKSCADQVKVLSDAQEKKHLPVVSTFRSHYDAKRSVCYVAQEAMILPDKDFDNKPMHGLSLKDAFENTLFAAFWEATDDSHAPVAVCWVQPASTEKRFCSSRSEFDELVKKEFEWQPFN